MYFPSLLNKQQVFLLTPPAPKYILSVVIHTASILVCHLFFFFLTENVVKIDNTYIFCPVDFVQCLTSVTKIQYWCRRKGKPVFLQANQIKNLSHHPFLIMACISFWSQGVLFSALNCNYFLPKITWFVILYKPIENFLSSFFFLWNVSATVRSAAASVDSTLPSRTLCLKMRSVWLNIKTAEPSFWAGVWICFLQKFVLQLFGRLRFFSSTGYRMRIAG